MKRQIEVRHVAPADLHPHPRNARKHPKASIDAIRKSIEKYGFVNPIIALPDGTIVAGEGRWRASRKAKTVPVVTVDMTEDEALSYLVVDNATTELSHWDDSALSEIARQLAETNFGLADIADFSFDVPAEQQAPSMDEPPDVNEKAAELREKWQVETGQVWQCGEHRIICGDCTDKAVVERVMQGERANLLFTDPPYGQNQAGIPHDTEEEADRSVALAVAAPCKDNACLIMFHSCRRFPSALLSMGAAGWKFERMLWMYKQAQCVKPWRGWLLTSEAILVASRGLGNWAEVHPYAHDTYLLSEVSGELPSDCGWHGSVKPMSVVVDLMQRTSGVEDLVFDPFLGSGTTILACERLGRRCRGIEIAPQYVAVCLERWALETGKKPKLLQPAA